MYVSRSSAAQHYGVTGQTVVAWADAGRIQSVRQPSGQRRYWVDDQSNSEGEPNEKKKVCYCRVSSHGQKDDLQRQIEYMRDKHPGGSSSLILDQDLIGTEKTSEPFFNGDYKDVSSLLRSLIKTDLPVSDTKLSNSSWYNVEFNSSATLRRSTPRKNKSSLTISLQSSQSLVPKSTAGENIKKKNSDDPCDAHERTEENIQEMVRNVS